VCGYFFEGYGHPASTFPSGLHVRLFYTADPSRQLLSIPLGPDTSLASRPATAGLLFNRILGLVSTRVIRFIYVCTLSQERIDLEKFLSILHLWIMLIEYFFKARDREFARLYAGWAFLQLKQ